MEHIKEQLKKLDREHYPLSIAQHLNIPSEVEPTLEERREMLRLTMGVSSLDHTFENFQRVKGTEQALKLFQELAAGLTSWKLLLCYGGVGNGKTYLCESLAIELTRQNRFARVLTFAKILRGLKQGMAQDSFPSYASILTGLCSADRLIIDDVGAGSSDTEFAYKVLEEIIVERYASNMLTAITTNRDYQELPERVISRFSDPFKGRIVLNSAGDYRLQFGLGEVSK